MTDPAPPEPADPPADPVRVAAVQMCSGDDKQANLATAERLLTVAADRGATVAVLPEMFNNLGSGRVLREGAEPFDGPTTTFAREVARRLRLWLVAGSFIEVGDDDRRHNTSVVVSPAGEIVGRYRKVHLFDVSVPGAAFRESEVTDPGGEVVTVEMGGLGRVGLSLCYDVRFPELYRIAALQGAGVVVVPAAFTAKTGPPHWEVLLRARAIENQVYVVAAAQHGVTRTTAAGKHGAANSTAAGPALAWHGHSLVVDPWGVVVAQASDGDAVVLADVDPGYRDHVRTVLPSLANRRPEAYRWP